MQREVPVASASAARTGTAIHPAGESSREIGPGCVRSARRRTAAGRPKAYGLTRDRGDRAGLPAPVCPRVYMVRRGKGIDPPG